MPFGTLWLPVLVSAGVVWIASAILHMVLPHHKSDFKGLPDEGAAADALRKQKIAPGQYVIPHCNDMKQMKDPEMIKKYEAGPVAIVTVLPSGPPAMGKALALWLVYNVLVSFVVAYVARHTLAPGADGMLVMRMTSTVTFAAYALGGFADSIWMGRPWGHTAKNVIDGLIYGLLTGLTFMLLWPAA